jgi:hypothetical protein
LNALAVFLSRRNPRVPCVQRFSEFVTEGVDSYYTDLRPKASQPLPISGNDLINYFGLKPSAAFRTILKTIEEEHLAAKNLTRKQALKLVANLLSRAKSSGSLINGIQISEPHGMASDD